MATLIVGEEPCTIARIVDIMGESTSFTVLCTNWKKFARTLKVPEFKILELKNEFGENNFENLMVDLLYVWKGRCGDDARLEVLCEALTASHTTHIAHKLEKEFGEILKPHILASGQLRLQDHVIKISDVFTTPADIPPDIVFKQFSNNSPIQILSNLQIPNRPRYYIQRTVSPRTRLNTNVFKSASSDVFVLENVDWSTLDNKLFGSNVERSSTQTVRVKAKFILLDFDNDYECIYQVVTPTPVHLVRFDRGNYYWVRSRGSLELIQQHVSTEQVYLSEEQFVVNYLSKVENAPVCLADTPGMGKSLLLASIAQRVRQLYPDRVVLFLVLSELEQLGNAQAGALNTTAEPFWKHITTSDFAVEALKRLIESGRLQFEVFLDGFDEVLPTQIDYVNQLILSLKHHKNIRIHVTTRPHMRNQLEETLGVLGYNILAFTEDNQVDFLTRFWGGCKESENETLDDSRLKSFANKCLAMLKEKMSELDRDIAGIPLQCGMLADVYAYDAVKYSIHESITEFEVTCKVESIFDMFQQLVKKKMDRVDALGEVKKKQMLKAHVHEAVKLIFPSWVDKLACIQTQPVWRRLVSKLKINCFAPQSGYSDSFLANLYAVGLMEPSSGDASPRFVHRTFAEFLIAQHLVKHLTCTPCSRLLLDVVLGKLTSDSKTGFRFVSFSNLFETFYNHGSDFLEVKCCDFNHNVIAYFVDAHLGALGSEPASWIVNERVQNADEMLSSCCVNNYASIFKLLSKVDFREQVDSKSWTNMALVAARYSERNLMDQLVQLIQCMEAKNLSELEFSKRSWDFPVTPLHVAVQRGSYVMTRYLVNQLYTESLPYLLHSCVYKSTSDSDAIIKDKVDIIRLLVGLRKDVVHERLAGCNATPLLLPNVHVDLIQALIVQGADVNAVDWWGNTVLHMISKTGSDPVSASGYTQLFNLLRTSNFNCWDNKNKHNETPLFVAVKSIEVEQSVLDQYYDLNVDFNHAVIDSYGNNHHSLMFAAISGRRTASFIEKLEKLGADVNYVNSRGKSALHIAARKRNYDVARYLVMDRSFDVNHRDCERHTPLHAALFGAFPNDIKIQALLIDNGAELEDPEYKWRPTPLHYLLSRGGWVTLDIVKLMMEKGLGSEHLALALEPLVSRNSPLWNQSEYCKLFQYLYEHGGRLQNAAKKLEQRKGEFTRAIAINDQLLEQLKVAKRTDDVVLDGIRSASDLYERIVAGDIRLELLMLALLECNQLKAFDDTSELFRHENRKFKRPLPEVEEFILTGYQMIVVAALDVELCAGRVLHTIAWVEEYQEGKDLLPGTLCLVKVHEQELNFREYLGGLAQLPYRFIVVCEKSLVESVEQTHQVVPDHFEWDDLTREYKDELTKGECIGFKLINYSKETLFRILRDESLVELITNGRVSTDDLATIVDHLVEKVEEHELKVLEGYYFRRLFPPALADIMNAGSDDFYKGLALLSEMKWSNKKGVCVGWFIAARAVLKASLNDQQQQMHQMLNHVFECEECYVEKHRTMCSGVNQKCYRFKNDLLVLFIDWLVGRGYNLSFDFQPNLLDKCTLACLHSNAVNLTNHILSI